MEKILLILRALCAPLLLNHVAVAAFSIPAFSAPVGNGGAFIRTCGRSDTQLYQTPSLPSWEELSAQKSEALKALSSYHDGNWICDEGAISSDASGNNIMRSMRYESAASLRIGLDFATESSSEALKIVESLSWNSNGNKKKEADDSNGGMNSGDIFFARTVPLSASMDVDPVDGSYSVHSNAVTLATGEGEGDSDSKVPKANSCDLPQSISGIDPARVTSVIENCLVCTEIERVRCFMLYGKSGMQTERNPETETESDIIEEQRLLRVVVSHEKKAGQEDEDSTTNIDDLMQSVVGGRDGSGSDRLDMLSSSMSSDSSGGQMKKFPVNMMTLSLGPWLGDTVVRERSYNSLLPHGKSSNTSSKGFGSDSESGISSRSRKQTKPRRMSHESGFGEWVLGVQKVAIAFKYDFDTNVRVIYEYGKSIGVFVEGWPGSNVGVIYDDRMSRRIKPEDRSMAIDFDNGAYCGFIFGSVFMKASRFLTSQRQGRTLPMLTECAVFQKAESDIIDVNVDNNLGLGEDDDVCCSRITRLYNDDGTLKAGCTSFFTLKPVAVDETAIDPSMEP
mmetsp:Transcript_29686/g.45409  ORF Transcript_29686/g.45409 Transcript_29686/m.45409 type:complete len:564 (+) Transcript_29686:170-1861(+)